MEAKIRVLDLAKTLSVDSQVVMEVLQTLNVDVKNHMSTVDQETAEKVTEAVKRTAAKKPAAAAKETARTTKAVEPSKPVREANPAKASLLEDFFGAGSKPRQRMEDMKRDVRPVADRPLQDRPLQDRPLQERPLQERRPLVERARLATSAERPNRAELPARPLTERPQVDRSAVERPAAVAPRPERRVVPAEPAVARRARVVPAAEKPAVAEVPAPAAATPAAQAVADPTPEPAAQGTAQAHVAQAENAAVAAKRPRTKAAQAAKAEAPAADAEIEAAPAPAAAVEPAPVVRKPAVPVAGPMQNAEGDTTTAEAPSRTLLTGPVRSGVGAPTARTAGSPGMGLPRPAAAAGPSLVGLPTRPVPGAPAAERSGMDSLPRRPAPGAVAAGGGLSGLGLPSRPVPGAARPSFDRGPRPGGFGAGGSRPGGPRPGGMGGFGGNSGRTRGGVLAIPKVDPKVAEAAKPADGKRPIGQGGDRKKGDAFTKRETAASRPSEEKLFGRRPIGGRASIVERRSLRPITIEGSMTAKELAHEMGVTASEVIKKLLTGFGIIATINQELDTDTCVLIGGEFGIDVTVKQAVNSIEAFDEVVDANEADEVKELRNPVVTIMGHVDHGKTSLLDAIRSAKVAAGEAGGITQHIGAYEVEQHGRKITFLDTPGHEAFTAMRARGANVTDIAVLVVAADDSVMPQTIESINHATAAGVPILVAVNKIDKPGADPGKVKQDLTAHGLVAEEWGGETIMVPVSAKQHTNLDLLLENILILADMQDLKANPNKEARGTVLEAELDKARGPVATVLVREGTLNNGDTFVAGTVWGKVRAMFDHRGRKLKTAGPSTPVRILGFNAVPAAGDVFRVAADERVAREVAEKRLAKAQSERQGTKAMSLDDFMSKVKEGEIKDLNLIIKADVQGSAEALRGQLEKLHNDEVQVKIVHGAVGAVTETDVMLAAASKAIIIGFNVRPDDRAGRAAADQGIDIRTYDVIYNIVDDIKAAMTGMLAPKIEENILGRAEVRETFKVPKVGMAAGCMVTSGKVTRASKIRLIRDGIVVWTGEVNALRRFKDEAKEVAEGYECGITLEKFQDFKPGDVLEAFEMKEVKAV